MGGNTGDGFEKNLGEHPKSTIGGSSEGRMGHRWAFRAGIYAPFPGEEADDTATHAAVRHLERLHAEMQLLDELQSMPRTGDGMPEKDMSQCVYCGPRDDRDKRTAQPGLPPPPETPEAEAARHQAMAERMLHLLTETNLGLSTLSIAFDTTSGSAPGAKRTSAAVVPPREPSRAQEIPSRPPSHRQHVPTPAPARREAHVQPRGPMSESRKRQQQREACLAHALPARQHTGDTPTLRNERYRPELVRVAGEVVRAQATVDPTSPPPPGGGGGDAAARRELCAGCRQSKRRAQRLIRKYGFCFRCLRKHLVNLGELRSCGQCRRLRGKEDYFLYDRHGAQQKETQACASCRWRKRGKCELLCGRPD